MYPQELLSFIPLVMFGNSISSSQTDTKLSQNFPSLSRIEKNVEVYTAQDHYFKIHILNQWMNCEHLFRNLSFTVENKIGEFT